jgi:ABC-2 type transport system permease protein
MSLRRIGILLGKELIYGPKNFIFILAIVAPTLLTLVISLVFGSYFSGSARVGVADLGSSEAARRLAATDGLSVRIFPSSAELRDAASRGAVDLGLVLPAGFDAQLRSGEAAQIQVYVWGESQLQHRVIASTAIVHSMRTAAGQEPPVEIVQTILGEGASIPWEQRLLPLVILMSVLFGGLLVPSTSLVNEKEKRTLSAVSATPTTMLEIYLAKWALGVLVSMFAVIVTLFLNRAFGGQPLLLLSVLLLSSAFSATIGVMMGALLKDISSLFAAMKGTGIFLYGPGIVYMFPEIPQWVGKLFPTYYVVNPILEITQNGAGLSDVALDLGILSGLILVSFGVLVLLAGREQEAAAAA